MIHMHELKDLALLEYVIWSLLERASADKRHAMHLCAVCTVDNSGVPDSRMVVLRAVSVAAKTLSFHTDIRSGKINSLKKLPQLSLLFWDKSSSVQLRVKCRAVIHHKDETALKKLSGLSEQETDLYTYKTPPGSLLDGFEGDTDFTRDPGLLIEHFCWIECKALSVEFLHLGRGAAHTRALFEYENDLLITSNFLKA